MNNWIIIIKPGQDMSQENSSLMESTEEKQHETH